MGLNAEMEDSTRASGGGSLVRAQDIHVHFSAKASVAASGHSQVVRAVDGVSFSIRRGEVLGLVGESGCGKSTISRAVLKLVPLASGRVEFEGRDLGAAAERDLRLLRRRMQMVFQDPYASLNPAMTVYQTLSEMLHVHRLAPRTEYADRVRDALKDVEMDAEFMDRYPHEFSGGQRQRVCIARALIVRPEFLVADEPVSSLDVSVQAQIVNLLQELQKKFQLTYLFISHDLSVVRYVSNRIAIMYLGKIVELAPTAGFFESPMHPYSQALLSAVPVPDPDVEASRKRIILAGELPGPSNLPKGCRFSTRCWKRMDICTREEPLLREGSPGHLTACHLYP